MGGGKTFHADVRRDDHCARKGMVYAKIFVGDGVIWDENMIAISASSA